MTILECWPGYLKNGYFDPNGNLFPELVAREQVERLARAMANGSPKLSNNQIRRFFRHCRAIEVRLLARTSTWEMEQAVFMKLDVAAADAFGKKTPKIPEIFHDFVRTNVRTVKTEKDFIKGFLPHFEALVGFGRFQDERGRS